MCISTEESREGNHLSPGLERSARRRAYRDPNVFLMGEEVAEYQGAYKVSAGLLERFGAKRIIDTPISENGFAGLGIGAAMVGFRPIIEFMTFSFSLVAFDQVVNNAQHVHDVRRAIQYPHYISRAEWPCPSACCDTLARYRKFLRQRAGLESLHPCHPRDAKGLLKTAIRDNNRVLVLEAELLYSSKGMVEPPDEELLIPLGKAEVKREGSDVTVVCYAQTVPIALNVAAQLEEEDISVEIVDLRSIKPLDEKAIFDSVTKTHRVVIVEQDHPFSASVRKFVTGFKRDSLMSSMRRFCAYHRKMCRCLTMKTWSRPFCRTLKNWSLP